MICDDIRGKEKSLIQISKPKKLYYAEKTGPEIEKRDMCEHKLSLKAGRGDTEETEGLCVVNSEGQG